MKIRLLGLMMAVAIVANARERSVTMFLAFNGRPTDAQLERKLDAFAAGGINSFMFYPTSGLGYEYLGRDFFHAARTLAAGAAKRGMKMWLYDEHNWPSGSCMGRVPAENEDFREWQLAMVKEGTNLVWRKVLSPETVSSMCTGGVKKGWPNLLEPRAVDRFIGLTHDVYAKELAPWIKDGTVRGIFTDEPFHPVTRRWLPEPHICSVRWYDGLEEDYRTLTAGRDFRRDVEVWYRAGRDPKLSEVWINYNTLYARRFRSAFFDRIRSAADRMGILATGHMVNEYSPRLSVMQNGDPLEALSGLSFPGMDEIFTRTEPDRIEWLTLATVQYAIRRNGRGGMVELYALGPANMTVAKALKMLRICAMFGVTRYFTVMSAMDASWMDEMHGFTVGFGDQQPWFAEMPTFLDAADAASADAAKRAVFDVALRFPRRQCVLAEMGNAPMPDVVDFLRQFECSQLGVELIREEDSSSAKAVFAFDGKLLREERSRRKFSTISEARDWALSNIPERFVLREEDGRRAADTLVRNYEDGTHSYLRLGAEPARKFGGRIVMAEKEGWTLALDADPIKRLPFDTNGVCRVTCDKPLRGVRLVTRGAAVQLDGKPVEVSEPSTVLRPTYDELYKMSTPFELGIGTHEFRLSKGQHDCNWFLPAAFLVGSFVDRNGKLSPMRGDTVSIGSLDAIGYPGFCGTATWKRTVQVPKDGALSLKLDTGGHFTRVKLGGRDLGAIGWGNFEWKVPAEFCGRTLELEIIVRTSIVPMFGKDLVPGAYYWGSEDRSRVLGPSAPSPCGLLSVPVWK